MAPLARRPGPARTLVRYDERGCGLSDHDVDEFSLDAWVHDLETVVDDLGLERFPLLGVSRAAPSRSPTPPAIPDRVSRLVLFGALRAGPPATGPSRRGAEGSGAADRDGPPGMGPRGPAFRRFFTSSFIPDAPAELWEAFAELLRRTTSAENAAR